MTTVTSVILSAVEGPPHNNFIYIFTSKSKNANKKKLCELKFIQKIRKHE